MKKRSSLINKWNKKLSEEGFLIPNSNEESLFGEKDDKFEVDRSDPIDDAIIRRLQTEGDNNHYAGSPRTREILIRDVHLLIDMLQTHDERSRVGIHSSCITGSDCIIVSNKKGDRHHLSTRFIENYDRKEFENTMLDSGYEVKRIFEDS